MTEPSSPSLPGPASDHLFALKGEARRLREDATSRGQQLSHSAALEQVARARGFRDWNALSAEVSKAAVPSLPTPAAFAWQRLDEPLPKLPMRIIKADELPRHGSVKELMRWAQQFEFIADKVAEDDRSEAVTLVGERTPYVVEKSLSRWPDGMYHLCDRGYEVFKRIVFSEEQVQALGLPAWNEQYGQHDGDGTFTVVGDDWRYTRNAEMLKRMARLLASLAMEADKVSEPLNA